MRTLADGTTKRLTTHAAMDYAATWSADGSRIAFIRIDGGEKALPFRL